MNYPYIKVNGINREAYNCVNNDCANSIIPGVRINEGQIIRIMRLLFLVGVGRADLKI